MHTVINDEEFKNLYSKIKEQRKSIIAPVDNYGLIAIKKLFSGDERRFYMLISLLLSSQTKDIFTFECINNLIKNEIINFSQLDKLEIDQIKNLISKSGFANKKAKFLKILAEQYKNKNLPQDYNSVMRIKGIGQKMAYLYLNYGCEIIEGIGVDTHVLRVSNRLGIDCKNAEICEKKLKVIFDKEEWKMVNFVFVGFGQEICKAINPRCDLCCIKNLCQYNQINKISW
ncbi:hypothetical protein GVAV_002998 [Gurleya vavrai]